MRAEFTKATKLDAWTRANGHCEQCTAKLFPGNIEYHHDKECAYGGTNSVDNCILLCRACHGSITRRRMTDIAKSNRVRAAHLGIKRGSGRPLPGSKASGWKRKMSGTWERRT
jgi:5-methylcytosine-specific restriction enzyme A